MASSIHSLGLVEIGGSVARRGFAVQDHVAAAYHYALLKLSGLPTSKIPSFLILDLPAEVEGEKVADKENFVIEPLVALCRQPEFADAQIIVAGSAFQGLSGVRRIELNEVWK